LNKFYEGFWGFGTEYSATQKISRFDDKNWHYSAADIRDFESWVIGKTLEQLQTIHRSSGVMSIFDDELSWIRPIKTLYPTQPVFITTFVISTLGEFRKRFSHSIQ